jgi:hypothetical protein
MRVISKTVDWESWNLINESNAEGGFLPSIGEEDNPDSNRKQRKLFTLLVGPRPGGRARKIPFLIL